MSLVPWKSVWGHLNGICWDKMDETYLYKAGGCCCDNEKGELICTQNPSWWLKSRVQGGVGVSAHAHVPPSTGCECGKLAWEGTIPGLWEVQRRSREKARVLLPPALQNSTGSCPRACGAQLSANFPGNKRYNYCNGWVRLSLLSEQRLLGNLPQGELGGSGSSFLTRRKWMVTGWSTESSSFGFVVKSSDSLRVYCIRQRTYSASDFLSIRVIGGNK